MIYILSLFLYCLEYNILGQGTVGSPAIHPFSKQIDKGNNVKKQKIQYVIKHIVFFVFLYLVF